MPKLLIIGYVWPEPTSSAAGVRMMQLIHLFKAKGYSVTFATTAVKTHFMADLDSIGVTTENIHLNSDSFNEFIKQLQPDIVLFDRFMMEEQFGWRVSEVCPRSLKILDTEDLHFLRKARQEALKQEKELDSHLLHSEAAKREIASIYRCDLSLIISEVEMDLLQKEYGIPATLLFYLPIFADKNSEYLPAFGERNHFVSLGNFRHAPNMDAVIQLKEKIWPLIRKELPSTELHIYGAYPTEKVNRLEDKKAGFLIKGRAEDSNKLLCNSRVLLAPLRFGAGIKGKFIEAMSSGTPSVTSQIGAEAMSGNLDWNGRIEDNPKDFSKAAVSLYTNQEEWQKAQTNGFKILEKRFSGKHHQERVFSRITAIQENLVSHRRENFTGTMLTHHSLQSTRYLSKYIEMKTRLSELENKLRNT